MCSHFYKFWHCSLHIYTHTHTVDVLRVGGGGIVGTLCAKRIYYDLWCQRVWDAFGCGGNDDTCTAFFSSFFLSSSLSAFHAENKLRQKVSNFGAISFLFYFSVLRAYLMILQTHFLIQWRFHFSIQFWYWCLHERRNNYAILTFYILRRSFRRFFLSVRSHNGCRWASKFIFIEKKEAAKDEKSWPNENRKLTHLWLAFTRFNHQ